MRQPEGALNVKYGITSNLTLDFTYNPDFSQIESDQPQIEVNQRFPLFFPELRPFFLEGQEIFRTRGPANLLHTRTIVDPRYGAKVTGKVGKTTIGLLFANDEASGKLEDRADPAFGRSAQFLIARARYDLYAESYVGAIVTDREFLDQYSRVGGIDASFRIGRSQSVSLSLFQSQHRDSDGVERSGPGWSFSYNNRGLNLTYSFSTEGLDPDFRTDTGFVRRVDTRQARANVGYRWYPESWIINWGPQASYDRNYDFEGILQDEGARIGLNASFAKNINVNLNVNRDMERFAGINFFKTRYSTGGFVNASRRIGFGGFFNWGRPDPVQRRAVSRRWLERDRLSESPPDFAFPGGLERPFQPSGRSVDDAGRVRRQDLPRVLHLSVHRAAAAPEHHGVQHVRPHPGRELAADLSREFRDGVLHRIRRSLPAGRFYFRRRRRRPALLRDRLRAHEQGLFHEDLVSVPLLDGAAPSPHAAPAGQDKHHRLTSRNTMGSPGRRGGRTCYLGYWKSSLAPRRRSRRTVPVAERQPQSLPQHSHSSKFRRLAARETP